MPRPVIFVLHGHQPLVQNHFHLELPTPVIINRLLPLLHGYDAHVALMLSNGFREVSHFILMGFPCFFVQKIYSQHFSANLSRRLRLVGLPAQLTHLNLKIFVFLHWVLFLKRLRRISTYSSFVISQGCVGK